MTEGIDENESPSDAPAHADDTDATRGSGPGLPAPSGVDDADSATGSFSVQDVAKSYLELCSDYLKRQLIVYENWPQYKLTHAGYSDKKVFRDQNN